MEEQKKIIRKVKSKKYILLKPIQGYAYFPGDEIDEKVIKDDLVQLLKDKSVEKK